MVYEYKGVDGLEKHLKDKSYVTGRETTPSLPARAGRKIFCEHFPNMPKFQGADRPAC